MLLFQNSLLKLVFSCFLYTMVYTCYVPGCKTGYKSKKNSKKHTLFGFPNDEKLKENWIVAIPRKNWVINKNYKVCSNFLSDDIQMISVDSHDKRRCDQRYTYTP